MIDVRPNPTHGAGAGDHVAQSEDCVGEGDLGEIALLHDRGIRVVSQDEVVVVVVDGRQMLDQVFRIATQAGRVAANLAGVQADSHSAEPCVSSDRVESDLRKRSRMRANAIRSSSSNPSVRNMSR